jgi:hypothetical protein
MANIGTNIGNAISDIIKWLTAAIKRAVSMLASNAAGNPPQDVTAFMSDILLVVTAYLDVINQFFPKESVAPFPKNFFSRLTWVSQNFSWIAVLMTLVTGANPFDAAKAQAAAVAAKWGF